MPHPPPPNCCQLASKCRESLFHIAFLTLTQGFPQKGFKWLCTWPSSGSSTSSSSTRRRWISLRFGLCDGKLLAICNSKCALRVGLYAFRRKHPSRDPLATPFCWTKFPKKVAKFETKFPKISPIGEFKFQFEFQINITKTQPIAKGAGGKGPRQKTSKIAKKCQKVSRHFSRRAKKRQKSSKSVKKFFDTSRQFSRGTILSAPFGCVTPCAAKTCAVRPVFRRVVGKLGAADPGICSKGRESKC